MLASSSSRCQHRQHMNSSSSSSGAMAALLLCCWLLLASAAAASTVAAMPAATPAHPVQQQQQQQQQQLPALTTTTTNSNRARRLLQRRQQQRQHQRELLQWALHLRRLAAADGGDQQLPLPAPDAAAAEHHALSLSGEVLHELLLQQQWAPGSNDGGDSADVAGAGSDSEQEDEDDSSIGAGSARGIDPDEVAFWIGGVDAAALAAAAVAASPAPAPATGGSTRPAPDEAAFAIGGEPAAAATLAAARALAAAADRGNAATAAAGAGVVPAPAGGGVGAARSVKVGSAGAGQAQTLDEDAAQVAAVMAAVREAFAVGLPQEGQRQQQQQGAGGGSTSSSGGSDSSSGAGSAGEEPPEPPDDSSQPWTPRVLDAPVPKYPRLYGAMPVPPPTILGEGPRAAARAALDTALQEAAATGQAVHFGAPGLGLEDKLLLMRLLGHVIRGDFDDAGRLDPAAAPSAYWGLLDRQLEAHATVKHMFEPTWYKCGKLNPDLLGRSASVADMEAEGQGHILAWLGLTDAQLPRHGEAGSFDELVALLEGPVGAADARIVSDPLPFLATTRPPLDRSGMPLLVHMTTKDKGRFTRHHMIALASWGRENPGHALLLYDDVDQDAYIRTYEPASLPLFCSLKTAVERSDLWRYVVMCHHGGVYTDTDTLCVRPIQEWNKENGNDAEALFGVEDVFRRDPATGSSGWGVSAGRFGMQFEQWTLAGAPGHPVYCSMPAFIQQRMTEQPPAGLRPDAANWLILHRTGPHVWTDSLLQWLGQQGVRYHEALAPGGQLVSNNTRILPGETFGCAAHFFSPGARLEEVYAMHMFRGVWRQKFNDAAEAQLHATKAQQKP